MLGLEGKGQIKGKRKREKVNVPLEKVNTLLEKVGVLLEKVRGRVRER